MPYSHLCSLIAATPNIITHTTPLAGFLPTTVLVEFLQLGSFCLVSLSAI